MPSEEDGTLTGFDPYKGHLETLSGKTFIVREGKRCCFNVEHQGSSEGGEQPRLHITCKTTDDCVVENTSNHQAVHGPPPK